MSDLSIKKGSILVYRVFDLAEEIDLIKVESLLRGGTGGERLKLARSTRGAIVMRNAPVTANLGEVSFSMGSELVRAEASARIWDYGVMTVTFQIPIAPGTPASTLISRAAALEDASQTITDVARARSNELGGFLAPALKGPHEWDVSEDYLIHFIEEFSGLSKGMDLFDKLDVPSLILAETKEKIAQHNREAILEESTYQYAEDDLVVIDWNSALVVEPGGSRDVPDILEFALTHMMELRYYDDLLDKRLDFLYDEIVGARRSSILGRGYLRLSREANSRYIEFSEFIERVDNSLKVVGDFYLARLFRAATRQFRLRDWQESITRKMNLLAQVSQLLLGEVNVQRSHWLEIIIILLILFEILSAIFSVNASHPWLQFTQ